MKDDKILILRTCANNMADHGGIIWPLSGIVECKYWKPVKGFENGLTGLAWGKGSDSPLSLHADARWVVAEVPFDECIAIETHGWVKFPRAEVLHVGTKTSAMQFILHHHADYIASTETQAGSVIPDVASEIKAGERSLPVVDDIDATIESGSTQPTQKIEIGTYGSTLSGTHQSQLIAGYGSTETAGDNSTLIAGYGSTGTAGADSALVAGYGSTQTAGEESSQMAGYGSTQTGLKGSDLTAGYGSTGTAGDDSSLIAGYGSTQTAGEDSSLTAGYGSTQTAQKGSDLTAGYGSTGTAGSDSSLIAGYGSTQTAGEESSQTAGYGSTQTAQKGSDLTAGYGSTGTAG
ncbi:Ice nucleation protein, partial [Pantoea allii]